MPFGCRSVAISAWVVLVATSTTYSTVDAFLPRSLSGAYSKNHGWPSVLLKPSVLNLSSHTQQAPEASSATDQLVDFYKVLGVSKTASDTEIKTAFRKLAKLYHPDVNPGKDTTTQFQTLNRAYEILSTPSLRKNFDRFGHAGIGTSAQSDIDIGEELNRRSHFHDFFGGPGGAPPPPGYRSPMDFDTFNGGVWDGPDMDFSSPHWRQDKDKARGGGSGPRRSPHVPDESMDFDSWFGSSGKRRDDMRHRPYGPIIGDDIAMDYHVDFKTAVLGGRAQIELQRIETCDVCEGTGAQANTQKRACQTCGGSGISIPVNSRSGPVFSIACPDCHGTGENIVNPCGTCHGSTVTSKRTTVTVDIPAGVTNGSKIRFEGLGDMGPHASGLPGDLFLFLKIKEDPLFRRDGNDIHSDALISCVDAIVGTSLTIPVIDGEAKVEIEPGTQPGHVICIKRKGAASLLADQRGDHFVTINIEIPNAEQDTENELVQWIASQRNPKSFDSTSTKEEEPDTAPHNFSVSFPFANPMKATTSEPKGGTTPEAESIISNSFLPSAPEVASGASSTSTIIDMETLAELKDQAALAEEERKQRLEWERLAAEREKDLEAQTRKLQELEALAHEARQEREHLQEIAAQRQQELEESVYRQEEMNKEITIRVRQIHNGQTTRITLKKSTQMSKIIEMLARQKRIPASDLQFSFQGRPIHPEDTPLDLSMDMNSMVDLTVAPTKKRTTATEGGVGVGVRF